MNGRKDCKDKKALEYFDKINNERLETTRKRVAHAINILKPTTWCTYCTDSEIEKLKTDIAHATNLLDAAAEEMRWHCEWFEYDTDVVTRIDDACSKLGQAMAETSADGDGVDMIVADVADALVLLAKALATLIRWNDDDVDVSEV